MYLNLCVCVPTLFSRRFVTPNHKSELCTMPRTPTPFKSAMEKYGPLQPLVSICGRHRRENGSRALWLCRPCVHIVVMYLSLCVVSAADSELGGRHKRGHPERRRDRPGGRSFDSARATTQNYGNMSRPKAVFSIYKPPLKWYQKI